MVLCFWVYEAIATQAGCVMSIRLSIIVPAFNGERYLRECLNSVVDNQPDGVEVIVVDDGSTDATREIAASFRDHLNLVLLTASESGGGWCAATNRGMNVAQGEYLCWLHQDDRWEPGRYGALCSLMERFPDASAYFSSSWYVDPGGAVVGRWTCPLPAMTLLEEQQTVSALLAQCFVATCAPVFRRELLKKTGILDEDLWFLADWDFWLRIARAGAIVCDSEPRCSYRLHAQAQSFTRTGAVEELARQYGIILKRHGLCESAGFQKRAMRVARFSAEVNLCLACRYHGQPADWKRIILPALRLGLPGWWNYLRHSRIVERVRARVRAGACLWGNRSRASFAVKSRTARPPAALSIGVQSREVLNEDGLELPESDGHYADSVTCSVSG